MEVLPFTVSKVLQPEQSHELAYFAKSKIGHYGALKLRMMAALNLLCHA
jgi:hypothetical protein